ncbi:arsenate reductase family protein [Phaeobacter sp. C3_T13_0]|uniref:arsenate reductase family protein n=1 Tax=Phaeobacter cretensis TaxID=3342641 RepID=UPI0039BC979E
MQIFGLKTCDTCRKALKQLPQAEFVDVRADGVPTPILESALAQFGDRLVNTRSTTWRGMSEDERAGEPLALLAANPTLMKRPLIKSGEDLHLGWDAKTKAALGVDG